MAFKPDSSKPTEINDELGLKEETVLSDDSAGQLDSALEQKKAKKPSVLARHWVGIALVLISTIAAAVLINLLTSVDTSHQPQFTKIKPKPPVYYASLSGVKVETEAEVNKPITAIMIPNDNYGARPQSGIGEAEFVFEAIAEGGITRFMALYQNNQPSLVGPIRSVRPYYLSWVEPFNASISQTGASARAKQELLSGKYRNIGFDSNAKFYWRDNSRRAPNNVYTSFEKINQLNQSKGFVSSAPDMFLRQDGKKSDEPNANRVDIKISRDNIYNSFYNYDATANNYTRHQGGQAHQDRESGPIKTDVIIAIRVVEKKVMEDGWREDIEVVGSGEAHLFQNGTATKATWRKPESSTQIRFYDDAGTEIAINRGKTWIVAVPTGTGAVSWQ